MVNRDGEKDSSEKKRRKASNIESSSSKQTKEDVYESIIRHEAEEAQSRPSEKDSALFHETCNELKRIFDEIATLKKDNSEKAKPEILEKRIQGSLIFVLLKKLNRLDKIRLRAGRDALHKEKLRVDSNRLQLQNLLYELNHLKREVERCYQFKSQDEEIDLVTEEEFYATAPPTISRPEKTQNDEHAKRLARLEWELQQRKELSKMVKELTITKENVSKDISARVERLNSLAPCLEALLKSTRPLQTALDMEIEKEWEIEKSARLLPRPLYLLYVNLSAYGEACDHNMCVTIEGDEEDVRQMEEDIDKLLEQQQTVGSGSSGVNDENQDSDIDDNDDENINKHHKRISVIESKESKRKNLMTPHPLTVILTFKRKTLKENLSIKFTYFPNIGIATSKSKVDIESQGIAAGDVISPENIFNCLYPDDFGDASPNAKTKYQLTEFDMNEQQLMEYLLEKDYGKPYQWVQRLCGLQFAEPKPSTSCASTPLSSFPHNFYAISYELAQNSVPTIIKTIRSRWSSRLYLFKQIHALENKNIDPIGNIPDDDDDDNDVIRISKNEAPIRISSSLVQWTSVTWDDYSTNQLTEKFIEKYLVNSHDLFYRAIITRNSAKLECLICISTNFPKNSPLWTYCLSWNGKHDSSNNPAIREMELWTNSVKTKIKDAGCILSVQLKRTMSSLDIFLETEGPHYSPAEFIQDKTFLKAFRGRTRARPYKIVQNGSNVIFKQI